MRKIAIIIGAGPAGLTAAYEFVTKTDIKPIVIEKSNDIGGYITKKASNMTMLIKGTPVIIGCGDVIASVLGSGGIKNNQPQLFIKKYRKSCNSKGLLDGRDISKLIVFLLSDESKYISGQNLVIDDGWTL